MGRATNSRLGETRRLISIGARYASLQRERTGPPPLPPVPPDGYDGPEGVARGVLGVVLVNEPPVTTPFSFMAIYPGHERRGSYQPTWRILSPLHFRHPFAALDHPPYFMARSCRENRTNIRTAIRSMRLSIKSDGPTSSRITILYGNNEEHKARGMKVNRNIS